MKTTILTLAFSLLTVYGVQAQDGMNKGDNATWADNHDCIMAAEKTWVVLGLTADQIKQVKDIQKSCADDKMAAKDEEARMESDRKHEQELKLVLTPVQYTNWTVWCKEQQPKDSEELEQMNK